MPYQIVLSSIMTKNSIGFQILKEFIFSCPCVFLYRGQRLWLNCVLQEKVPGNFKKWDSQKFWLYSACLKGTYEDRERGREGQRKRGRENLKLRDQVGIMSQGYHLCFSMVSGKKFAVIKMNVFYAYSLPGLS